MRTIFQTALIALLGGMAVYVGSACSNLADDCENTLCDTYDAGADSGGAAGQGGAGGTSGQGGTGGTGGAGGSAGDGGCDPSASPNDDACVISDAYGVFVSPSGNDTSGDGTQANPYKTIGKGLTAAKSAGKKIYVCATGGAYVEDIVIDAALDGSELYGGFDCGDWSYSTSVKAMIDKPSAMPLKVSNVTSLVVEDFEIVAADAAGTDASGNGNSSIAMFVTDSTNVAVRRSKLTAGKGAPGAKGTETLTAADKGANGANGSDACVDPPAGGAAATTKCAGLTTGSVGGKGGSGATSVAGNGSPGDNGQPLGPGGQGGDGHTGAGGFSCTQGNGTAGNPGNPGNPGNGAKSSGNLTTSGFAPAGGGAGTDGTLAQGGGGGGGAKAPLSVNACGGAAAPKTGASGGSGGGGGCGGKGGGGGGGGGASIGFAAFDSAVTLNDVDFAAAAAGTGANGGAGQPGGNGGTPGLGGNGMDGSEPACPGGQGGKGGNGGPGGGGAGGPSIALAWTGTKPTRTGGTLTTAASPALGGADGLGQTTGAGAGIAGLVADEAEL